MERDGFTCQLCKRLVLPAGIQVDHIVPLHMGGGDHDDNKQCLCLDCHDLKSEQEGVCRSNRWKVGDPETAHSPIPPINPQT